MDTTEYGPDVRPSSPSLGVGPPQLVLPYEPRVARRGCGEFHFDHSTAILDGLAQVLRQEHRLKLGLVEQAMRYTYTVKRQLVNLGSDGQGPKGRQGQKGQLRARSGERAGGFKFRSLLCLGSEDFEKGRKGVPVAAGDGGTEMALELAQAGDGSHVSPVNAKGEPASNGDDPDQPVVRRWKTERKCRQAARSFPKDTDEANGIRSADFTVISVL